MRPRLVARNVGLPKRRVLCCVTRGDPKRYARAVVSTGFRETMLCFPSYYGMGFEAQPDELEGGVS
eukprot:15436593-Alexandrium_andersonii.AAC.1